MPLSLIIGVTMLRSGIEDYRRHRSDAEQVVPVSTEVPHSTRSILQLWLSSLTLPCAAELAAVPRAQRRWPLVHKVRGSAVPHNTAHTVLTVHTCGIVLLVVQPPVGYATAG